MKRIRIYLFSIIVTISANAFSQHIEVAKLDSAITFADKLIETDPREFFKNVESFIVWSQGNIISEKYYHGYKDTLHHTQSQTKSIVSLLMGIAIDKGFIKSENVPVFSYFPEYFNADDKLKYSLTIRDLLTMSAGFEWEEMIPSNDPRNDNMNMYNSGNYLHYALTRPMAIKPGGQFKYNSGCPVIIAGIIEKATHQPLDKFAEMYLFGPLNIKDYYWLKDSTGFCHAGGGLYLKPVDMLKLGVLVQNKGKWEDKQVISEQWITKMTQAYFVTSFDNSGYGFFWWIKEIHTKNGNITKMISAEGAGGQKLYLFMDYELIIAFTEHNYNTPQVSPIFIKQSILPILQ
ncbi:MAG TPA: serine hydrolase [Bacteroidales bacterium]|nr:serine hydrolase [Bacteroidales bacterium]